MLIHVVDDSESNLITIGHMVMTACRVADVALLSDPLESLERCREATPDLIMVDYVMPGMDGIRYIEEIRRLPGSAAVPIVMVTASTEPDLRGRAMRAGATGVLTKPLRYDDVRATLTPLLGAGPAPGAVERASGA